MSKMARRIVGMTGIGLWLGLIALTAGLQVKANGNEQMFKNLPEGWKVEKSIIVSKEQMGVTSSRLGGEISKLTNTILSFKGQQLQVNVIQCPTNEQTEKVYKAILQAHNGVADYALRDKDLVVEFAQCNDVKLAIQARRALGLELARLDSVARKLIRKIPTGWQIENSFIASPEQTDAVGKKLGGRIKNLSNTIFSVQGKHFQVNVFDCTTPEEAGKITNSILKMKADPAFCLQFNNLVVEFVGDDAVLAKKAVYELAITPTRIETQAKGLVKHLTNGNYEKAVVNFDSTMKQVLPAEKLKQVWESLIAQVGAFVEQRGIREEKILGYNVIFVTCQFEKSVLDAKVVFNDKEQIAGLFFVPPQTAAEK
jgi:hypothetical protein